MFANLINNKFDLNKTSLYETISDNNQEIMVYGFEHCKYKEIINFLKDQEIFKKVDKWDDFDKTLEGKNVSIVLLKSSAVDLFQSIFNKGPSSGGKDWIAVRCKETLLNLCLENYERSLEHRSLIPMLYCVDIENNPHPFQAKNVASEDPILNGLITHKELRLCYKVANEIENIKVQKVFKDTLKFVKLLPSSNKEYKVETIAPFWEQSDWKEAWDKRKINAKDKKTLHSNWKAKFNEQIQKINNKHVA